MSDEQAKKEAAKAKAEAAKVKKEEAAKAKAEDDAKNEKALAYYISDTKITDIDFAKKLYALGIERQYIKSFTNAYAKFDDETLKTLAKEAENDIISHDAAMIRNYMSGSLLTDEAFAYRLYRLSFPPILVQVFKNEDVTLTDAQLWDKVRNIDVTKLAK